MDGQSPDQAEVGSATEKTPREERLELLAKLTHENDSLDGKLLTAIRMKNGESTLIFNVAPNKGSHKYGVHPALGPVDISVLVTEGSYADDLESRVQDVIKANIETHPELRQHDLIKRIDSDDGYALWEQAYNDSKSSAEFIIENEQRVYTQKALAFVGQTA